MIGLKNSYFSTNSLAKLFLDSLLLDSLLSDSSKIPEISVGIQMERSISHPSRFLPTGMFETTSVGGPIISVGIFRPKFAVPLLTNQFFALTRELEKGMKSGKSPSCWLARFNQPENVISFCLGIPSYL